MKTTANEKRAMRARWNELGEAMRRAETVEAWRAMQQSRIELERAMG